jgi:hypothetical protein
MVYTYRFGKFESECGSKYLSRRIPYGVLGLGSTWVENAYECTMARVRMLAIGPALGIVAMARLQQLRSPARTGQQPPQ